MSIGWALWGLMIGFFWGDWLAERRAKRMAAKPDYGIVLLSTMLAGIRDKRRFVGPECSIERKEEIEVGGERYTLSLKSEAQTVDGGSR